MNLKFHRGMTSFFGKKKLGRPGAALLLGKKGCDAGAGVNFTTRTGRAPRGPGKLSARDRRRATCELSFALRGAPRMRKMRKKIPWHLGPRASPPRHTGKKIVVKVGVAKPAPDMHDQKSERDNKNLRVEEAAFICAKSRGGGRRMQLVSKK